jgi:hypothetical protein
MSKAEVIVGTFGAIVALFGWLWRSYGTTGRTRRGTEEFWASGDGGINQGTGSHGSVSSSSDCGWGDAGDGGGDGGGGDGGGGD